MENKITKLETESGFFNIKVGQIIGYETFDVDICVITKSGYSTLVKKTEDNLYVLKHLIKN